MTENELKNLLAAVTPPDECRPRRSPRPLGCAGKPLGGLGRLEAMVEDAAALTGDPLCRTSAAVPCWCSARTTALWRRASARPMPP